MFAAQHLVPAVHRLFVGTQPSYADPQYYRWLRQFHEYNAVFQAVTLVVVLVVSGLVFNKRCDMVMMLIAGLKLRLSE